MMPTIEELLDLIEDWDNHSRAGSPEEATAYCAYYIIKRHNSTSAQAVKLQMYARLKYIQDPALQDAYRQFLREIETWDERKKDA